MFLKKYGYKHVRYHKSHKYLLRSMQLGFHPAKNYVGWIELQLVETRLNYQFVLGLWNHLKIFVRLEVFRFNIIHLLARRARMDKNPECDLSWALTVFH